MPADLRGAVPGVDRGQVQLSVPAVRPQDAAVGDHRRRAAAQARLIAIMNHQKHRFVERVDYVTSPGSLDGGESRAEAGLGGGPAAVITDRCILRPHGPDRELHLASVHPGHGATEVRGHTGWDLKPIPGLAETPPPSRDELAALHAIDKDGVWR